MFISAPVPVTFNLCLTKEFLWLWCLKRVISTYNALYLTSKTSISVWNNKKSFDEEINKKITLYVYMVPSVCVNHVCVCACVEAVWNISFVVREVDKRKKFQNNVNCDSTPSCIKWTKIIFVPMNSCLSKVRCLLSVFMVIITRPPLFTLFYICLNTKSITTTILKK